MKKEQQFREELLELLKKYGAEISVDGHATCDFPDASDIVHVVNIQMPETPPIIAANIGGEASDVDIAELTDIASDGYINWHKMSE